MIMKIGITLTGTIHDLLSLEKFLESKNIEYSSPTVRHYHNLLGILWIAKGWSETKIFEKHLKNILVVLDVNMPESELLSFCPWYEIRKERRVEEYKADITKQFKRVFKRMLGLSYEELAPFQVFITAKDTYITLVWQILIHLKVDDRERRKLLEIATKKRLTLDESALILEYLRKVDRISSQHLFT